MALLGNMAKGEDRTFRIAFASLPSGAAAWNYSLKIRHGRSGTSDVVIAFGSSEYDSGSQSWSVTVPAASSATLTAGANYVAVWRTGTGTNYLMNTGEDEVMVLDRPGS